jgi:hypothetical protein
MERRQFLAGASVGLTVTATGCTGTLPFFDDTGRYDTGSPEAAAESWALLTELLWGNPDAWLERRGEIFHSRARQMDEDVEQEVGFFRRDDLTRPVEEITSSNTVVQDPTPAQIKQFLRSADSAADGRYDLAEEFIERVGSEEIDSAIVDVRFQTGEQTTKTIDGRCLVAIENGEWQVIETDEESDLP